MKGNSPNIVSSWPIIFNENALNEATQQQTPMSHSHPCLFLDGTKSNEDGGKRPDNLPQQAPKTTTQVPSKIICINQKVIEQKKYRLINK
uniref:Uncharacterized protein n=1 Tax=Meloidogyne enterolobii TaxID=390850 RepID=A0A6V7XTQ9_MELEN|nr:unnamed protein product [Meloidogyne enterolobii]